MNPLSLGSSAVRSGAKADHGGAGLPGSIARPFLLSQYARFILWARSISRCAASGFYPVGQHDRKLSRLLRSSSETGITR